MTRNVNLLRSSLVYKSGERFPCYFKILTGKHTGKIPLGRLRRKCEVNIRMNLKEIDIITRNWVDSAQERDYWRALLSAVLNLRAP